MQMKCTGLAKGMTAILVISAISLAACMPVQPATPATGEQATAAPAGEATEEATEAPTAEATAAATDESTPQATEVPVEGAGGDTASGVDAITSQVTQMLAQQLQISAGEIEVVSAEAVDWPDSCIGVQSADTMCAQVITPGYKVVLNANGQQYEYHTNADGSFVQLASGPEASVGNLLISWQQMGDTCQSAQIGSEGVAYGPCMGVMMNGKLVAPERATQLSDLVATYAAFEAQTAAGDITFKGEGSTTATAAEQRMIAEWARQAVTEVSAGRTDVSLGLALAWHREGGFAGFCDDLSAYVTGLLQASSCRGANGQQSNTGQMNSDDLEQLYTWLDEYAPFTFHHDDGGAADSMTLELIFHGLGDTVADDATQQEILNFAQELFNEISQ
jgi:hypothetical protein